MLSALVRFSIRFHVIVIIIAALILLYGSYRLATVGLDIFPEFSPKRVSIQTESAGLSPEQVEVLVTQRIETAISGLINLESVRSESIQSLSIITATFSENSDSYKNRQLISERLAGIAQQLPPNISPVVVPLSSSSATVLTIGLTAKDNDLMALRSLVDWTLVPRLLAVSGVADINVFGGDVKQLQVQLQPDNLRRFNLSVDDITQAVKQAVNNHGGGFIENDNQRFTVQVSGLANTPETLSQLRIGHNRILLSEVATINYAPEPPISAAQIMGKQGIVLMVIAQYGANTLTVSRQVGQTLEELMPLFNKAGGNISFHPHLFKPADYIERSINNLAGHLLLGGLFVVIVLYLFLFNFKTAFISALAIPVSLMSAALVLMEMGISLNIMVLGGLAIALGEVVDDAIIDTENIFRRLREYRLSKQTINDNTIAKVVYKASLEVRSSVVYASFIVALVFVPLLTLGGVAGRLFAPLGYSYILAILMSLLVALTLTPALCFLLLKNTENNHTEPPLIAFLQPLYKKTLSFVTSHFIVVSSFSALLCVIALLGFNRFESKFLPELREGHYIVHTTSIPGTALTESIRIGSHLTEQFKTINGVESVSQWAGRSARGADTYGSHYSEYEVRLKPTLSGQEQQQILLQLRSVLKNTLGIVSEVNTFLTERIDETISGYTAPVVINLYGNDLNELDQKAQQVVTLLHSLKGATDIQLRSPPSTSLLQVRLNLEQLNFLNINAEQVINTLKTAYETQVVGSLLQGNRTVNVAVTLEPQLKTQTEVINHLPLRSEDGLLHQLNQVADIVYASGRYNILHQNAQRKQTITCQVIGRDWNDFMAELKTKVWQEIQFNADTYPEFTGSAIEQAQARQALIIHSLLAATGVLLLIYIAISSGRNMFLTLLNIPFALVGGIVAVYLTGGVLSVGSIVGFVTLFGITVRNSIMLLSHYRYLVEIEKLAWNITTALQGAQERLPSILMTALVTALAMFPLIGDNAGQEIMSPMAAIIIGGLAFSTVLNLLLLPSVLLRFGRF
ncbi:MAG: efflux RND transporter permease subunit [Methylococcaceae bacterium]